MAAALRIRFRDDLVTRAEPVRARSLDAFGVRDPFAADRAAELVRADGRFAAHPAATVAHALSGGLFLLIAPLQFSSRIRRTRPALHRWSGRMLLPLAIVAGLSGLYFGVFVPFAGMAESVLIALVGVFLLVAVGKAFAAIRARQVARHREWVIRVFATALAISTVRLIAPPFDLLMTPAGLRPSEIFLVTIWTGWAATLTAAELWIRRTRAPAASVV